MGDGKDLNYSTPDDILNLASRNQNWNGRWMSFIMDAGTNNTTNTWVPVFSNDKIQHRVMPLNIMKYSSGYANEIKGGWEGTRIILDWIFNSSNCVRISYDPPTQYFMIQKQVNGKWTALGHTYLTAG